MCQTKRVYVQRIQFSRAELVVVHLVATHYERRLVDALHLRDACLALEKRVFVLEQGVFV